MGISKRMFAKVPHKVSMRGKLFFLFLLLVTSLVVMNVLFSSLFGIFQKTVMFTSQGVKEHLIDHKQRIELQFGQMSAHAVEYAKAITKNIEQELKANNLTFLDVKQRPEFLEPMIAHQLDKTLLFLEKSNSSGAFFILDATINPDLNNARFSKAGIYLKNMEPNVISATSSTLTMFHGFPQIGRNNEITLHSQWTMEVDVSDAPFYWDVIHAAQTHTTDLSKLYRFQPKFIYPNSNEEVMLISVPMQDSNGQILGVAGLEISSMLFKLSHMPDTSQFNRMVTIMAPMNQNQIAFSSSLMAGNLMMTKQALSQQHLTLVSKGKDFHEYEHSDGTRYLGYDEKIVLYPQHSLFADQEWIVISMVPAQDINRLLNRSRQQFLVLFFVMVVAGCVLAYFLSKQFMLPIYLGMNIIKNQDYANSDLTNEREIDELIAYLASHKDEIVSKSQEKAGSLPFFDVFLDNIKTLSAAERAVFELYIKGYSAKEATQILCVSINTIKTHNKRIYAKLNVSSRDELMAYIGLLQEQGIDLDTRKKQ